MTRGFYMELSASSRSDSVQVLRVLAAGWDGGSSDIAEVGTLVVAVETRTASFFPSGHWITDPVVGAFLDVSLEASDSYGLWMRWLLELGAKALANPGNEVSRFI